VSQELEIVNREPQALAVSGRDRIHQAVAVIAAAPNAIEKVEVMERLMALDRVAEDREAERKYAAALGKLQAQCQNVVALKDVDGKFRYAPFLDIWNSVRPAVERNGFTLQWSQDHLGDRIKVTLTLQHEAGHKRDFNYTMRLGSSAPGTPSGAQAPVLDSQAESRAKRRLLMDALNVVVDTITPAEDVGDGTLASEQDTTDLYNRLAAIGGDQKRFLALAGVEAWSMISKAALPILQRLMVEKERATRKGAA
jgi:hypothetical protein